MHDSPKLQSLSSSHFTRFETLDLNRLAACRLDGAGQLFGSGTHIGTPQQLFITHALVSVGQFEQSGKSLQLPPALHNPFPSEV